MHHCLGSARVSSSAPGSRSSCHRSARRDARVLRFVRSYRSLCRSWVVACEDTLASRYSVASAAARRAAFFARATHPLRRGDAERCSARCAQAARKKWVKQIAAHSEREARRLGVSGRAIRGKAEGVLAGDNPRATERSVRPHKALHTRGHALQIGAKTSESLEPKRTPSAVPAKMPPQNKLVAHR